jgi:hypothetical protein
VGILCNSDTFYGVYGSGIHFRCSVKGCNARIKIIDEFQCEQTGEHSNHDKNGEKIVKRRALMNNVKKLAKSTHLKPISILCKVKSEESFENSNSLPTDKHVKAIIKAVRKEEKIDEKLSNGINTLFYESICGFKFIHGCEEDIKFKKCIVFMNLKNETHLRNSKIWICDGTFSSCPKEFQQVYTIHAQIMSKFFPIFYVLLDSKSTNSYSNLLKTLSNINYGNWPLKIIIDFEIAIFKAVENVMKDTTIWFCFFPLYKKHL